MSRRPTLNSKSVIKKQKFYRVFVFTTYTAEQNKPHTKKTALEAGFKIHHSLRLTVASLRPVFPQPSSPPLPVRRGTFLAFLLSTSSRLCYPKPQALLASVIPRGIRLIFS